MNSMLQPASLPLRVQCPPGACECQRDAMTADSDLRVLLLTREEEKRLIARIDAIASYAELLKIGERLQAQLGIVLRIVPSVRGVRTTRGISIQLLERPGLCKKTRQNVPAAIRRCLDNHPDIVYALLDAHDLLGSE